MNLKVFHLSVCNHDFLIKFEVTLRFSDCPHRNVRIKFSNDEDSNYASCSSQGSLNIRRWLHVRSKRVENTELKKDEILIIPFLSIEVYLEVKKPWRNPALFIPNHIVKETCEAVEEDHDEEDVHADLNLVHCVIS